jgi:AbiV family abortive infection protein
MPTKHVDISKLQWNQMLHLIHDGIIRKLDSAKKFIDIDKDISAGLHTFALEEFGKLHLLERSQRVVNNTKRKVIYADEFTNHEKKFQAAFDYLKKKGHDECLVLKPGFFQGFSNNFDKVLLADLEARLSIFFSDFAYDNKHEPVIQKSPEVNINKLKVAINKFKTVVNNYPLPQ